MNYEINPNKNVHAFDSLDTGTLFLDKNNEAYIKTDDIVSCVTGITYNCIHLCNGIGGYFNEKDEVNVPLNYKLKILV